MLNKVMKRKFIILQGLPASGKSTEARKIVDGKEDWIIINMDSIRNMRGVYWIPEQETFIVDVIDILIELSVREAYNIVFDNVNLNRTWLDSIRRKVEEYTKIYHNNYSTDLNGNKIVFETLKYEFEERLINTPLEECISRDSKRERPVGEKIIKDFYEKYKDKLGG